MVESIERKKTEIEGFKERLEGKGNTQLYYKKEELYSSILEAETDLKILESDYYTKLTGLTSQAYKDIVEVKS